MSRMPKENSKQFKINNLICLIMNRINFLKAGAMAIILCAAVATSCDKDKDESVAVTGVALDKTTLPLVVGASETLTATVAPEDATNKAVAWSSSDKAVADVTDGTVKAVAAGTATITVTTADGGKTAVCEVSVTVVPGDNTILTPDPKLTSMQIVDLVTQAYKASFESSELTWNCTNKETDSEGEVTYYKFSQSQNRNTRTEYYEGYQGSTAANLQLTNFRYIEDFKQYSYSLTISTGKTSSNLTDAYWNESSRNIDFNDYTWTVEGNTLIGTWSEDGENETITFILTGSKKIASMTYVSTPSTGSHSEYDYTFTYSASPALPVGYNKADFTAIKQYKVKVVWNEGKGENIFYAEQYDYNGDGVIDTETEFYIDNAEYYAPQIAGKTPEFYTKADLSENSKVYGSMVTVKDDNTVLYVKWVASSSKSLTAAAPENNRSLIRRNPLKIK
jgi:hypothetical protein